MPGYLPLVVHLTNALKKPQLLNSNRKRKNLLLKHSWLLNQRPTGPMKQNKNILPHTLNPKLLNEISFTQNLNQENNAPIFSLNVKTATKNYYILSKEYNWIDVAIRERVCDQTCQYTLSISEKVKRGTPFNAAYNSALNKLYHYLYDAEMIFDLAMALINRATKKNVRQMKEAEYIEYTMELAGFDYENEVEVYHQIASHTYPTQEAQIQ
ncbi:hypothetical protein G9A89_002105 [Geosiphon pyriformis]|nr:hypothetical protein G9A89_002105 [Geosiphon pyriformis]